MSDAPPPFNGVSFEPNYTKQGKLIRYTATLLAGACFPDFVNQQSHTGSCAFLRANTQHKPIQGHPGHYTFDYRFECDHGNARARSVSKGTRPGAPAGDDAAGSRADEPDEACAGSSAQQVPDAQELAPDVSAEEVPAGPGQQQPRRRHITSTVTGTSKKVSCTAAFSVRGHCVRVEQPDGAFCYDVDPDEPVLVTYHQWQHLDKDARPCHGPDIAGTEGVYSRLSAEQRAFVQQCLKANMPHADIVQACKAKVEGMLAASLRATGEQAKVLMMLHGPVSRDYRISTQDVRNIQRAVAPDPSRRHASDAVSVDLFVQSNLANVFCYQRQKMAADSTRENPHEEDAFLLGIQTFTQLAGMLAFGHGRTVLVDATFAINKYMFPLTTIMVLDHHHRGFPAAFVFTSNEQQPTLVQVLTQLRDLVKTHNPLWRPSCFVVDCAEAMINALRVVFPDVPVYLCNYHVVNAWLKNILEKVPVSAGRDLRWEIFSDLRKLQQFTMPPATRSLAVLTGTVQEKFDAILLKHARQVEFCKYLKEEWGGKLDMLVYGFRAGVVHVDGTQHLESFHDKLKGPNLMGSLRVANRRLDYAVHCLFTKVAEYFLARQVEECTGAVRNKHRQEAVNSAIQDASRCSMPKGAHDGPLQYPSSKYPDLKWVVELKGGASTCTCLDFEGRGVCKHVVHALQHSQRLDSRGVYRLLAPHNGSNDEDKELGSSFVGWCVHLTGAAQFATQIPGLLSSSTSAPAPAPAASLPHAAAADATASAACATVHTRQEPAPPSHPLSPHPHSNPHPNPNPNPLPPQQAPHAAAAAACAPAPACHELHHHQHGHPFNRHPQPTPHSQPHPTPHSHPGSEAHPRPRPHHGALPNPEPHHPHPNPHPRTHHPHPNTHPSTHPHPHHPHHPHPHHPHPQPNPHAAPHAAAAASITAPTAASLLPSALQPLDPHQAWLRALSNGDAHGQVSRARWMGQVPARTVKRPTPASGEPMLHAMAEPDGKRHKNLPQLLLERVRHKAAPPPRTLTGRFDQQDSRARARSGTPAARAGSSASDSSKARSTRATNDPAALAALVADRLSAGAGGEFWQGGDAAKPAKIFVFGGGKAHSPICVGVMDTCRPYTTVFRLVEGQDPEVKGEPAAMLRAADVDASNWRKSMRTFVGSSVQSVVEVVGKAKDQG